MVYGATGTAGQWVALKLIRALATDDPEFRTRFARQIELMAVKMELSDSVRVWPPRN